jgi:NADH dehydrogenase
MRLEGAKLTLVEAGPALFSTFDPNLRDYAKERLESWNVEVLLGEVVSSVTPTRVRLESGRELKAHTLVWGAGLEAHPLAGTLGLDLQRGNRIPVGRELSVDGHPEVFAVGDVAWITDTKTGEALPQLGSGALQAGESAGKNIARAVAGDSAKPFSYHDKGTMATIGPGAAVIQFPHGRTMKGRLAFLAWGSVHLALLSTGEDRSKAVVNWVWAGFTHERGSRIVIPDDED